MDLVRLMHLPDKSLADTANNFLAGLVRLPGSALRVEGIGEHMTTLNRIGFEIVLRSGRAFAWSGLQVHRNVKSNPHRDEGVHEALLIVATR